MGMGNYDESEHQRREEKTSSVDASFDDGRTNYEGSVEYEAGDSAEALIDQFKEIKDE